MLTILLTGPKSSQPQARTALAGGGFELNSKPHDYGLELEKGTGVISVEGSDIDAAHDCVSPLGWRLTLHHESLTRED